jgi:nitrite reductase (NO-forming)
MADRERSEGANPFRRLRTVSEVVGVYLLALLAWVVAGGRWPGGRWFGVHLFTLGVVTNLVLALSDHFARTLTHEGGRSPRWQLPIANAGIVGILWGIPNSNEWVIAAGATVVTVEVMRSYVTLRRLRRRAPGTRFSWIVRAYERAHGAFIHGAILGALIGAGVLTGSWALSARIAHLHVNVLGWAGITLLATVVFFGPTIVRTRIEPGAEARAANILPRSATALTVAVLALLGTGAGGAPSVVLRLIAAAGLVVYEWGVVEIGVPLIRAARRAHPSAGRAALVAVAAWFAVVVALDVVIVATARWRYLDALGVAMLSGVLFQAIAASLGYLAPLLLRPDARTRARLSERIDRHGTPRTIAWNVGVACAALAAALGTSPNSAVSLAGSIGWGLLLATSVWLSAAILLPGPSGVSRSDSPQAEAGG